MITDAQFQAWLEVGQPRCALFELTFLGNNGGTPAEMHAYVANMPYISAAADAISMKIFEECVVECPDVSIRMGEQLSGRTEQTAGDLVLSNENVIDRSNEQVLAGGVRDSWLSMNWDGRRLRMWLGDPSWPMSDFRLVLDGIIVDVYDAGGYKIGFHISDKGGLLDRPIVTTLLGGDGPDAAGPVPVAYGNAITHCKPKELDIASYQYKVTATDPGGGLVETMGVDPFTVFEDGDDLISDLFTLSASNAGSDLLTASGVHGAVLNTRFRLINLGGTAPVPLAFDTDYWVPASGLTATEHKAAAAWNGAAIDITLAHVGSIGIQYYNYTAEPSTGIFQLPSRPNGVITCSGDCGLKVGFPAADVNTAGAIIEQALTSRITNTPFTSADIDAASLAAFKALCTTPVGIYIDQRMTFEELLDKMVLSVGGWWGFTPDGLLEFGRLDLPSAGTPVYSFIDDDVARRTLKVQRRILPRAQVSLYADINFFPLSTVRDGVDNNTRAFLQAPHTQYTGYPSSVTTWTDPANHLRAAHQDPYETYLVASGQQDEAERTADLFQLPTGIWGFETHHVAFLLRRGSLIYMDNPKFTGYGIVVGVTRRVRGRSTVEFFAQLPDVYPTADIE